MTRIALQVTDAIKIQINVLLVFLVACVCMVPVAVRSVLGKAAEIPGATMIMTNAFLVPVG